MSNDLFNTSEHQTFRDTVRKFAEEELAPRAREFDEMGRIDKSLFRTDGRPRPARSALRPRMGRFRTRLVVQHGALRGTRSLRQRRRHDGDQRADRHGDAEPAPVRFSDALKAQYLAPAIAGEMVAAIAVTEPDAGSDVAGIKTRAVRDGDDWVINGSKTFITNAATADWLCLLAVTDPDAGYGGFTQIVVPTDAPGLSLRPARQDRKLGLRHRATLLRRPARAGREHDRRHRARFPATDDAVSGRAAGRLRELDLRARGACGSGPRNTANSASFSGSR